MTVLLLKTVGANMQANGGPLRYPERGKVVAKNWDPRPNWGGGLHGLLWGEGPGGVLSWRPDAKWLVLEAPASQVVGERGSAKVPEANVVHCGDQQSATQYLLDHGAQGLAVVGSIVKAGYRGKATAGDYGTATAGDSGIAQAGNYGEAEAGIHGKAQAGEAGFAIAGKYGKAQVGDYGRAQAGYQGRAQAGRYGKVSIDWYDGFRYRTTIGPIEEDNLLPDTLYQLDRDGNFILAEKKI